jgi:hypothetical protein
MGISSSKIIVIMGKKEILIPSTPITEKTFIRQGWKKNMVGDVMDDFDGDESNVYYYTLPLPKDRNDEYTPMLVSNSTDELGMMKEIGLIAGTFMVEILGTDGLGLCVTEEELEILYKALTGEKIE